MAVTPKLKGVRVMLITTLRSISGILVLLLGALIPATHATTIISGNLYFTTFQNQGGHNTLLTPNVWKVAFVYDSVAGLCLGTSGPITTPTCPAAGDPAITSIATLKGADGLIFDPNDTTFKTILVGEQNANLVARITDGSTVTVVEKEADGAASTPGGQAYGVVVTPDKTKLLTLPNDIGVFGQSNVNVSPLTPFGNGVAHLTNIMIRGVDFIGNTAYYGTANDGVVLGHFGTLDLGSFATADSAIVDDVNPTSPAGQGALPSHGVTFDSFSGCMILSSSNQIWQLCPNASTPPVFHIRAKVSTPTTCTHPAGNPGCGGSNWDQTTVDGKGHLFAANNNGDLLFIDYSGSATKNIATLANYSKQQFLAVTLDDVVNGGGAPPSPPPPSSLPGRMTGGGSVFESDGTRVTHGFEVHCDTKDVPNSLEINWPGHRFHLETLVSAFCFKDPAINAGHPTDTFNTYVGVGTGLFDGAPGAIANWTFTDAGEPGSNDTATIVIKDSLGNVVLTVSGKLDMGNQQAHKDNK
jgi:hypothetical protein